MMRVFLLILLATIGLLHGSLPSAPLPTTIGEFMNVLYNFNEYEESTALTKLKVNVYLNSSNVPALDEDDAAVVSHYTKLIADRGYRRVLEVGPGTVPLPFATHVVNITSPAEDSGTTGSVTYWAVDLEYESIPAPDKHFDFVYCRSVLQDMHLPLHAFNEIKRVAKSGYIETPSPLVESLKLSHNQHMPFRGHASSLWLFWTDPGTNTLMASPKLPLINFLVPTALGMLYMEQTAAYIVEALSPMSRNSYSWDEDASPPLTPSMHVLKQTLDFEMQNMGCGGGYAMMLRNAVVMSMQAKLAFIEQVVPQ